MPLPAKRVTCSNNSSCASWGRQSGGGFVQKEQAGSAHEDATDGEHLALSAAQIAGLAVPHSSESAG